jgi:hypothetical protein
MGVKGRLQNQRDPSLATKLIVYASHSPSRRRRTTLPHSDRLGRQPGASYASRTRRRSLVDRHAKAAKRDRSYAVRTHAKTLARRQLISLGPITSAVKRDVATKLHMPVAASQVAAASWLGLERNERRAIRMKTPRAGPSNESPRAHRVNHDDATSWLAKVSLLGNEPSPEQLGHEIRHRASLCVRNFSSPDHLSRGGFLTSSDGGRSCWRTSPIAVMLRRASTRVGSSRRV